MTYSIYISFDFLYSASEEQENGSLKDTNQLCLFSFLIKYSYEYNYEYNLINTN